jgi:predicted RNase H-like HicB family nuclease
MKRQAATGGIATAIRTLLELGAAPDPRDHAGNTPLMIAAERGEVECIRILLAAGADPKAANEEGRSALDLGLEHLETWRGIVADGPDPTVAEMLRQAHEEVAKGFVGDGAPAVPEIPALMAEQATNHAQALEQAEEAAELLQRTAESSIRDARTRSSE